MRYSFIFIVLIISIVLTSCRVKNNKPNDFYVIKHPIIEMNQNPEIPPPPLLPKLVYGNHNFMLKDLSKIYYYHIQDVRPYKNEFNSITPPKLNLLLDSVFEINIDTLSKFLENNIHGSAENRFKISATISYPTDTIRNNGFRIITEYFKRNGIYIYDIRKWTGEEKEIMRNKN